MSSVTTFLFLTAVVRSSGVHKQDPGGHDPCLNETVTYLTYRETGDAVR